MPLWQNIQETIQPDADIGTKTSMQVKGTSLIATERFIKERFGTAGFEKFKAALSPEARALFGAPVLAPNWYPADPGFFEPMEKLCREFYGGDARGARELGRFSAVDGLRGVYKIFVRMASVDYILKKTANIFASYYRPGKLEVAQVAGRRITLRMSDIARAHPLFEERVCGWLEGALQVCGQENYKVIVGKSMARGEQWTEFVVRY
jgi:hypothetical protein